MADKGILLKDRDGKDVEYYGINTVTFDTTDGDVQKFTRGEAIEGVEITPDFSGGNQEITTPDGFFVKSAVLLKPEDLVPENIRRGVTVAGIFGDLRADLVPLNVTKNGKYAPTESLSFGYTYSFKNEYTQEVLQALYDTSTNLSDDGMFAFLYYAGKMLGIMKVAAEVAGQSSDIYMVYIAMDDQTTIAWIPTEVADIFGANPGWNETYDQTTFTSLDSPPSIEMDESGEIYVSNLSVLTPLFDLQSVDGYSEVNVNVASEDVNVSLDFSNGNMVISPKADKFISSVTVEQPETLLPENIAEGINIAGVIGTLKAGLSNVIVKTVTVPEASVLRTIVTDEELASIGFSTDKNCLVMASRICNDPLTLSNIKIIFNTWSSNYSKKLGDMPYTRTYSGYYYNGNVYRQGTGSDSNPFAGTVSSAIYYSSTFGGLVINNNITSTTVHNMVGDYLVVVICFE